MNKEERKFIDSWIEENVVLIATQGGRLLTHYKNTSNNYGEIIEKLSILKKNVMYRYDSKLLLPIIESAIYAVEHEKNTLSIKKEG